MKRKKRDEVKQKREMTEIRCRKILLKKGQEQLKRFF